MYYFGQGSAGGDSAESWALEFQDLRRGEFLPDEAIPPTSDLWYYWFFQV